MSNIHQLDHYAKQKQEQLESEELRLNQACDWITMLDRNLTPAEKQALQSWLSTSPENLETLLEVAKLWDKMDDLSRLSDLFPQSLKKHNSMKWASALAASIIFALTIGLYQSGLDILPFADQRSSAIVGTQLNYQTGIGESNTINLPDNSKIVLNTNSFVQIKYSATARVIELQRGEIHIDVAHDKLRPLSVIAGGKVIQAVGTAFNVEVRSKLVELIVTDGKVLVGEKKIHSNSSNLEDMSKKLPQSSMAISKGEKIDLDLTGRVIEKIIKVDPVEVAASLSWRQGNLIFRGESLADAMTEISRYTDIKFELADNQKLQQVKVAGMFKTGDVNGLLEVLNRNFNISHQKVGIDKIILDYAG